MSMETFQTPIVKTSLLLANIRRPSPPIAPRYHKPEANGYKKVSMIFGER